MSGTGSEIKYTENLRKWLIDFCRRTQIKTILDVPCVDLNWMRVVLPMIKVQYYGFDIVKDIIEKNTELFSTKNVTFSHATICVDNLPACELLIFRDCLFHLSYEPSC